MSLNSCVTIQKEWDIVGARQLGREMAKKVGFGSVDQARIATSISELARNIYLYAGNDNGQVCFEIIEDIDRKGIRMIAIDTGPGMKNISEVMEDGFTTSGGLGAGLPGVKRLMDEFDIKSEEGKGTEVKATKWLR